MGFKAIKKVDTCENPNCTECPIHFCEIEMTDDDGEVYIIGSSMGFKLEHQLDKWIEKSIGLLEKAHEKIKRESEPQPSYLN